MANGTNVLLVAMNLPDRIPEFIIKAKSVLEAMTGNANFPDSTETLNELSWRLGKLESSQKGLGLKPATSTAAMRDADYSEVKTLLRTLSNDVQIAANNKPNEARTIIESSSFDVRKTAGGASKQNTATDGKEAGVVLLKADQAGPHQWQQSLDGGETVKALNPTLGAKLTVTGLTPGVKVWFSNRTMLTGGQYGDWSQWIWIVPKVY